MTSSSNPPVVRLLRLDAVLGPKGPIPVSRSAWYAGIRQGRYPAPVHLSPRVTVWREDDIRAFVATLDHKGGDHEIEA